MRSLVLQISGISALLVLLNQLWSYASLERALVVTLVAGGAVYGVLLVGQAVTRSLLTGAGEAPPPPGSADSPQPEPTSSMQSTSQL